MNSVHNEISDVTVTNVKETRSSMQCPSFLLLTLLHLYSQFTDTEDKLSDIPGKVNSAVSDDCQCSLSLSYISGGEFLCVDGEPTAVLYRAELNGGISSECTTVVSRIKDWTSSGTASIAVQGNRVGVDPDCMLEIESLTSETTCRTTVLVRDPVPQDSDITVPIIGAVVGVIVLVVVVILAVVIFVYWLRRQARFVSNQRTP